MKKLKLQAMKTFFMADDWYTCISTSVFIITEQL